MKLQSSSSAGRPSKPQVSGASTNSEGFEELQEVCRTRDQLEGFPAVMLIQTRDSTKKLTTMYRTTEHGVKDLGALEILVLGAPAEFYVVTNNFPTYTDGILGQPFI